MSLTIASAEISREHLRTFHLAGRGLEHERPAERLHPVVLDALMEEVPAVDSAYPVYVAPNEPPRPLAQVLGNSDSARAIVHEVIAAMGGRPLVPVSDMRDLMIHALKGADHPQELRSAISDHGYLIGFHPESLALLYGAFLAVARRKTRSTFFLHVKQCVAGLQDLLAVDGANRFPSSVESVSASLGALAQRFLDIGTLTEVLNRRGGTRPGMEAERRARCESTLAILEQALRDENRNPAFWLFHSGEAPAGMDVFHGQTCRSANSCAAALDFCDQQLARFVAVLRAVRVARLEIESAFDPASHAELLDRFDWQAAEPDELAALPAVVIMESAEQLAQLSLTSFARLLRSGRPVQVLVPYSGLNAEDLSGLVPDFGYLAIAHREAFVLQSSLVKWDHLTDGLAEMTRILRPAVAIVSIPTARQNPSEAWLETALYYLSRAFPLYRYDPGRDGGWAQQFRLFDPGPVYAGLTALHAMAGSNQFREHFRIIPPSAWDDDQIDLSEYLAKYDQTAPPAVPFLWVAGREGSQQRAVFTRELVNLCRDRARAWLIFAELASGQDRKTRTAEVNLETIRQEAATEAYERVLALLADPEILAGTAKT